MNEMLDELKIDPEFEKVIPPLTKDEYHQLEENILDDGKIMMPIAVWGTSLWTDTIAIVSPVSTETFRSQQHSLTLPTATKPLLGSAKISLADVI